MITVRVDRDRLSSNGPRWYRFLHGQGAGHVHSVGDSRVQFNLRGVKLPSSRYYDSKRIIRELQLVVLLALLFMRSASMGDLSCLAPSYSHERDCCMCNGVT